MGYADMQLYFLMNLAEIALTIMKPDSPSPSCRIISTKTEVSQC